MKRSSPPLLACWIIELSQPDPHREALLGDLVEEYRLQAESTSSLAASRWFWGQACRSILPLAWSRLRRGDWLISLGVAVAVCVALGTLKLAVDRMLLRLIQPSGATWTVLAPLVFLAAAATGGCVAARIRRGAMPFLALIVMMTVAALIRVGACTVPVPWWYQLGFLTLGPLSVLISPAMFVGRKTRGERLIT